MMTQCFCVVAKRTVSQHCLKSKLVPLWNSEMPYYVTVKSTGQIQKTYIMYVFHIQIVLKPAILIYQFSFHVDNNFSVCISAHKNLFPVDV